MTNLGHACLFCNLVTTPVQWCGFWISVLKTNLLFYWFLGRNWLVYDQNFKRKGYQRYGQIPRKEKYSFCYFFFFLSCYSCFSRYCANSEMSKVNLALFRGGICYLSQGFFCQNFHLKKANDHSSYDF